MSRPVDVNASTTLAAQDLGPSQIRPRRLRARHLLDLDLAEPETGQPARTGSRASAWLPLKVRPTAPAALSAPTRPASLGGSGPRRPARPPLAGPSSDFMAALSGALLPLSGTESASASGAAGVLLHLRLEGLAAALLSAQRAEVDPVSAGERLLRRLFRAGSQALPRGARLELDPAGQGWALLAGPLGAVPAQACATRLEQALLRAWPEGRLAIGLALLDTMPASTSSEPALQALAAAASASAQVVAGLGPASSGQAVHDPSRCGEARRQAQERARLAAAIAHGGLELRLVGRAAVDTGALTAAQAELWWPRRSSDPRPAWLADAGPADRAAAPAPVQAGQTWAGAERRRDDLGGLAASPLERQARALGLGLELHRALLARVCLQLAVWQRQGLNLPVLAVRLPGDWVLRRDFAVEVTSLLQRHHVAANRLQFEVDAAGLRALQDGAGHVLADAGAELVADVTEIDLATLCACQKVPLRALSVAIGPLGDLRPAGSPARRAIEALVGLARSFGLRLIAKGVNDTETLAVLAALGTTEFQGSALSRPLPARTWTALLGEPVASQLLDAVHPSRLNQQTTRPQPEGEDLPSSLESFLNLSTAAAS
jgi:EAL domain-containing protein (putative c-di-GMP-specific phosphodiesterase class I)